MTHIQVIQNMNAYNAIKIRLPLPHVVKLIDEDYALYQPKVKYLKFYLIDAKYGFNIIDPNLNIVIKINDVIQEYEIDENGLYTLINVTNHEYDFASLINIEITGTNYDPTILNITPNRVNNSQIPMFQHSSDDIQIYTSWNHFDDDGLNNDYDIDTHLIIYGPIDENNLEIERKGEVNYDHVKYKDSNIDITLDIDDTGEDNGETITANYLNNLGKQYILYYVQYDWEHASNPSGGSSGEGHVIPYDELTVNPFYERTARVLYRNNQGGAEFIEITPSEDEPIGLFWRICAIQNGNIIEIANSVGDNAPVLNNWRTYQSLTSQDGENEYNTIYCNAYNTGYADDAYNNQYEDGTAQHTVYDYGYYHGCRIRIYNSNENEQGDSN